MRLAAVQACAGGAGMRLAAVQAPAREGVA